jgi:clan AA aspartic protease
MIAGSLTSDGEPAVRVRIVGPTGAQDVDALVDTGFNGGLTLPHDQITAMGLPEMAVSKVTLADGRVREVQTYVAEVVLGDRSQQVLVAEAPTTPLVGTDLLWGFSLYVEFQADGRVEIDVLSDPSD